MDHATTTSTTTFRPDGGLVSWYSSSRAAASAMSSTYPSPATPKPIESTETSTTYPHPDGHLLPPPTSATTTTQPFADGHLMPPSDTTTTTQPFADGHLMPPPSDTTTHLFADGHLMPPPSSSTDKSVGSSVVVGMSASVSNADSSAVTAPASSHDMFDEQGNAGAQVILSAALLVVICVVRLL